MKSIRFSLFLFCLVLSFVFVPQALAQTGSIQGEVTDARGGRLEGVRISVSELDRFTVTDQAGRYLLRGLPARVIEVRFEYLGSETRMETVTIEADETIDLDVSMSTALSLDRIEVRSQAQASSRALNQYRSADAVTNVVSSDDIGSFVDQNVAEALQRLPGISITRDQGEGRFVTIRGLNSNLNNVSLNGMRIGTPEPGNRELPLDLIPTGSVERLEVVKVPTPDMPGDAIGGAVNVVSPSAFDSEAQVIRYRIEGLYADLGSESGIRGELAYSNVFDGFGGQDNIGLSFGINYLERDFQSDNIETEYDLIDEESTGSEVFAPIETQQRKYFITRDRLGAHLNLDFRPNYRDQYFFNALYSQFNDAETRQRSISVWEDGDLDALNGGVAEFRGVEADGIRRRVRYRSKEQETFALALGGEHRLENWTIDYRAGYSEASEDAPDEIEGRFELDGDDVDADVRFGSGVPVFDINRGGVAADDIFVNGNFALDRVVLSQAFTDEEDANFSLNLERAFLFGAGHQFTLKFGADARYKDKDVDENEVELRVVPDLDLGPFTRPGFSFPFGSMGEGISSRLFREYFFANREAFGERPGDLGENLLLSTAPDFSASEDVTAAYLMGTLDIDDWRIIAGARFEDTEFKARGNAIDFDEDGELAGVQTVRASNDYSEFLPGILARYEGFDDIVLRAAWTNTLARPSFSALSPGVVIFREDLEAEAGNPFLDPITSSNIDLMFDWYLPRAGIFSIGLFAKDIDDFVVDFVTDNDPSLPGFEVERPINGTSGETRGIEFNFQHDLGVWNESLDGLLFGVNLTAMDTEFTVAERPGETFSLPQASESIANLYLGFERGPLSTRLSWSHRGKYLEEIGDDARFDVYVDDHAQLDLTASWRFTDQIEAMLEVINITDEALRLYQGDSGNVFQLEEYGVSVSAGLRGRF
ncbi:TonB-dependent receptor [Wenzhouxiangella marina]|uniref:TonB-dependent receptor n=1 Tax=Wenzhouxiangella marina TaxID=1579979 RepID=A0A0K0XUV5_9GAMM|nr:TonB-dependent receptor [Wenzhouxiangella marina]AKS41401.1 TonB-dependent receptor [Wenzhouxiangella marina]MBB6086845.1 TonB-dependent receptor [Wenzhouxiangella marina]